MTVVALSPQSNFIHTYVTVRGTSFVACLSSCNKATCQCRFYFHCLLCFTLYYLCLFCLWFSGEPERKLKGISNAKHTWETMEIKTIRVHCDLTRSSRWSKLLLLSLGFRVWEGSMKGWSGSNIKNMPLRHCDLNGQ